MTVTILRIMPGVPAAAKWLGMAGLLPFLALPSAIATDLYSAKASILLTAYGIAILSFMGGCRWGLAASGMGTGPDWQPLLISVVPAIYGSTVILLPSSLAMIALALGFAVLLVSDLSLARNGAAPEWWPALRWPLSIGAILSLCICAAMV